MTPPETQELQLRPNKVRLTEGRQKSARWMEGPLQTM